MEQTPTDIAIIQLIEACKFAEQHLSPNQFASAINEGTTDRSFLKVAHGNLAALVLDL